MLVFIRKTIGKAASRYARPLALSSWIAKLMFIEGSRFDYEI